jgi:hypothetical protein
LTLVLRIGDATILNYKYHIMFRSCALLLMLALVSSCSKSKSFQVLPASFRFTALGNNFQYDGDGTIGKPGAQIEKVVTTAPYKDSCYYLTGYDNMNNYLSLRFNASHIAIGTYTLNRSGTTTAISPEHSCNIGSSLWGSTHAGDFATVTITNIHDGWLADGTFSTTMSCMIGSTCAAQLVVTNGEFHNLKYFPF